MHISIWQQRASNHSSSFTIVGTFESPEKANEAAATVEGIIKDFIDWYERPENADLDMLPWDAPPTSFEAELISKYDLKADRHFTFTEDVRGSISVSAVDRLAVIDVGLTLDEPPMLLISLLGRLGSQSVTTTFDAESVFVDATMVNVTCNAPDAVVAEMIRHSVQTYFVRTTRETPLWGGDNTGARGGVLRDGTGLTLDVYFGDIRYGLPALISYLESHGCQRIAYSLQGIIGHCGRDEPGRVVFDEIVRRHGDRLSEHSVRVEERVNVSCLAPDESVAKRVLNLVHKPNETIVNFRIGYSDWISPGTVSRDGRKLVFLDLELRGSGFDVRFHLETIVAFLISFGCEDLVFELTDMLSGEQL